MGMSIAMRAGISAIFVAAVVAFAGPAAAGSHPEHARVSKVVHGDVVDARAVPGRHVLRAPRYNRPQIRRYTR